MLRLLGILALAALCLTFAAPGAGAAPLRLGFSDGAFVDGADSGLWLDRAKAEGATFVRLDASWAGLARRKPIDPTDPSDPAYDWAALDAAVRAATARGLRIVMGFTSAPTWAEGPNRPSDAPSGSWRPDPDAFGAFASAAALRYSGTFAGLPRVRQFVPWNEPNLSKYLSPQWVRDDGDWEAESPVLYRALLNAFYRGVKQIQPDATVVAGGTAPFGDPDPGGDRIMPARFTRLLLCLNDRLERSGACADPARFDAFDHHPYSTRGPTGKALNADDVSVPDMGKLAKILAAGVRLGTALPRASKPLWALEVSWDSDPPDPQGVPAATQARWLSGAIYELWRQNVDTIAWYQIVDQPPEPSYDTTYQSGVFLLDGTPKPSAQAFRFPFVADRLSRAKLRAWGKAPLAGTVRLERRVGDGWRRVASVRTGSDGVFSKTLALRGAQTLRAVQGSQTTLSWSAGAR